MANWVESLREWMKENNYSLGNLSKKCSIPRSSLGDYMRGVSNLPNERRKTLFETTGLEILSQPVERITSSDPIEKIRKIARVDLKEEDVCQGNIKGIQSHFYNLLEKMEYLKNASVKEREKIKKAIDSKDVGYFIAFMNAIYKPDHFNTWVAMSHYVPNNPLRKNERKK